MDAQRVVHPSVKERRAQGKELRKQTPPSSHAGWKPAADRPDPVALLEEQDARREPDLVPVRHGRMLVSPFTFYRGAARIMAADLKDTPRAGLVTQLCGDAHLSNFGVFASPERTLLFDLNDFDETLPGPFEYDVARMAASFTIAARNNGFSKADAREATSTSVAAYRSAMAAFAPMDTMDIWYARLSEDELMAAIKTAESAQKGKAQKKAAKAAAGRAQQIAAKAHTRDSLQALGKLAEVVDGRHRIVSQPPIVVPFREMDFASYGIAPTSSSTTSTPSSAPTGRRCRATAATCSRSSRSSTWRARWSASAAWARAPSSSCSRGATRRTRCSSRSRRRPARCSRTTSRRAATSPARASCTASA